MASNKTPLVFKNAVALKEQETNPLFEFSSTDDTIVQIPIEDLLSWPDQPRKYFPTSHIEGLARSIKERGLDYPLTVRPSKEVSGKYEVIKGECRFRASRMAGKTSLPSKIQDLDDQEALDAALDENLNREDLNPIEELDGILKRLSFRLDKPVDSVASLLYEMKNQWEKLGGNVRENVFPNGDEHQTILSVFDSYGKNWYSFTCSRLKLRKLPSDVYEAIAAGKIEYTKGLKFKAIRDEFSRQEMMEQAIGEGWTVREIGEKIQAMLSSRASETRDDESPSKPLPPKTLNETYLKLKKAKPWKTDVKKWQKIEAYLNKIDQLLTETETDR